MPSVSQDHAGRPIFSEALSSRTAMNWRSQLGESKAECEPSSSQSLACGVVRSIRGLPTELLIEIFRRCVDRNISLPLNLRAPWSLITICRRWRAVALTTPYLWMELTVDWRTEAQSAKAGKDRVGHRVRSVNRTPIIRGWLDCAQCRPLTLVLNLPIEVPCKTLSDTLKRHASHIRNLSLSAPLPIYHALTSMTQMAVSRRSGRFPMLEVLHLSMPYKDSDRAATRRVTSMRNINFRNCKDLKEVYLDSGDDTFGFITDKVLADIPYVQLTDLSVVETALDPLHARNILMQCSNLVKCNMRVRQWDVRAVLPSSPPPVTLSSLRVLIIEFCGTSLGGQIAPFFDTLTAPALAKLTIAASYSFDANLIPVLVRMQTRSRAPLQTLALMGTPAPYQVIPNFLRMLPQLRYLRIEAPMDGRCYSYSNILTSIKYKCDSFSRRDEFLPALEEVYIADNLHSGYSDGAGRLERNFAGREVDISQVLKDYEVLDAIESRCWSHGEATDSRNTEKPYSPLRRAIDIVTMRWRNVPFEWRCAQRPALARKCEMEEAYPVDIYLPLEL